MKTNEGLACMCAADGVRGKIPASGVIRRGDAAWRDSPLTDSPILQKLRFRPVAGMHWNRYFCSFWNQCEDIKGIELCPGSFVSGLLEGDVEISQPSMTANVMPCTAYNVRGGRRPDG